MSLKNLNQIGIDSKNSYSEYNKEEIKLTKEFKLLFTKVIQKNPKENVSFSEFTSIVKTSKNLTITFPNQWFYIASYFVDYLNSLKEYKYHFNKILNGVNKDNLALIKKNKQLPTDIKDKIDNYFKTESDRNNFTKFLTDYDWWFGSKTIDRNDYFVSPILSLAQVVNVSQGYIAHLAYLLSENSQLLEYLNNSEVSNYIPKSANNINEAKDLNLKDDFAEWLFNQGKYNRVYKGDKNLLIEKLSQYENAYETDFGIPIFDYPNFSLETILKELKTNIIDVTDEIGDIDKRTVGNGSVRAILGNSNYIKFLKELIGKQNKSSATSPRVNGINKVYFGAPGTGKSYQITEELNKIDDVFQKRIIFHPEYDNSLFIGGYKPVTDDDGNIKYQFAPQTFTDIYVEACNDPENQYYLIIEEINRGNCAEIFGELFQLLDRDPNYPITPSKELVDYLNNNISNNTFYREGKMLLPENLSLLATMNTSDQSLFPMDSAFKRRWDWEYIPICYTPIDDFKKKNISFDFKIDIEDGNNYSWVKFIEKINLNHIKNNASLGMDKCIGNYFIKPDNDKTISLKPFVNKVIFYLWNDVFKDEDNNVFEENTSYEDFFPMDIKGKKKLKELFNRIELKPTTNFEIVEDLSSLGQVAENTEELDS